MIDDFTSLELLHTRDYDVQTYLDGDVMYAVGTIRDQKPAGMYIADDPEPLEIHHMRVVLEIQVETLTIVDVKVDFDTFPHTVCPSIIDSYRQLIGVNVARGFNRQVRELFGGPRGCAHTTALLQSVAPVVIQSLWSIRMIRARNNGSHMFAETNDPAERESRIASNLNTCHVWDESGDQVAALRAGEPGEIPVWIASRLAELGRTEL